MEPKVYKYNTRDMRRMTDTRESKLAVGRKMGVERTEVHGADE